jgi:hypothetical protein
MWYYSVTSSFLATNRPTVLSTLFQRSGKQTRWHRCLSGEITSVSRIHVSPGVVMCLLVSSCLSWCRHVSHLWPACFQTLSPTENARSDLDSQVWDRVQVHMFGSEYWWSIAGMLKTRAKDVWVEVQARWTLCEKVCGSDCCGQSKHRNKSNLPYNQLLLQAFPASSALSGRVHFSCLVSDFLLEPVFAIHTCLNEVFLVSPGFSLVA